MFDPLTILQGMYKHWEILVFPPAVDPHNPVMEQHKWLV